LAGVETVGADAVMPPRRSAWRAWRAGLQRGVTVGRGVAIGRGAIVCAAPGARVVLEDGAALGAGARVEARGGELRIGAGAVLGARASVAGAASVGAECVIGDWARVEGDAVLEPRARLAAHAVALGGARVGAGAVVGSYTVVDGAVAPGARHWPQPPPAKPPARADAQRGAR
jgi:UDP-3-O-[3-hydroxymyristoyl] glucosamine N-acyltransferase